MNMAPAVLELSEGERAGLLGWHALFSVKELYIFNIRKNIQNNLIHTRNNIQTDIKICVKTR